MNDTERQIQRQATLQQETKRLCDQAEAQLRNTERDLHRLTRQLNEKQNTYDKRKKVADNLTTQAEHRRTAQVTVDQELSQLSSTLQSRRAKIARTQRNIYQANQYIEAHETKQTYHTKNVTVGHGRFEEYDREDDEEHVTTKEKLYA
ncbi:unnamed protein product [Rotaria sp. Silwood2]|nr:unnamed protein product [Rotaria sp. Silwood2]CAF4360049.1 unnamed protein product [Rotaria sp. Silwood2]